MDKLTRRIALAELKELKAREAEYRAEREEWYRSGDGRRPHYWTDPETGRTHNYGGKGYTFPYCEHGSSRWTDYDNICGPCEDGYSVYQLAIWNAEEKVSAYRERCDWVLSAPKHLDPDTKSELVKWAISALD
ncbi:hypothetical protein SEA_BILLNYE_239 [Streptomyces phage BillNye]|uniref:Uncharacterized protein n=1 Tax=Streptomyces phage BillNye TaxID=2079426 RepID=A0A2L1IW59_9CAUD|nr:hypothetical protein FDJ30_gp023 [Streptomyces phage BillNye]AVD99408.1 hypothetical protein SEA_BILLNYE_239 [Streptomyces phage BillNye]